MYSLYHLKIIILHMPVFYNSFRHQKDKLQLWLSAFVSKRSRMTTKAVVILSEQSESKDLGTNYTANADFMRRFFDAASPCSE